MIDAALIPLQRRALRPLGKALSARGVSADAVTLTGFALGMLALPALANQAYALALVFIITNRLLDGLDGVIARQTQPSDRGAFLDIALDFLFYAAVPLGFALADPDANALAAAVLIAAFVGTGTSFLAFAIIAAQRQMQPEAYPTKGIYYLGGLTEGAETIGLLVIICLLPEHFAIIAYCFAIACAITTASRLWQGWQVFK